MERARARAIGPFTPRRWVVTGVPIVLALLLGACEDDDPAGPGEVVDASAVIRVPAGYPWAGALIDHNGTRQVQGSGPATLGLVAYGGTLVAAVVQKGRSDGARLEVCIALGGVDRRCADGTAPLATVQASGQVVNQTTLAEKSAGP